MGKTLCKNKTNEFLTFTKEKGNLAMNGGNTVWWDRGTDRNRKSQWPKVYAPPFDCTDLRYILPIRLIVYRNLLCPGF